MWLLYDAYKLATGFALVSDVGTGFLSFDLAIDRLGVGLAVSILAISPVGIAVSKQVNESRQAARPLAISAWL